MLYATSPKKYDIFIGFLRALPTQTKNKCCMFMALQGDDLKGQSHKIFEVIFSPTQLLLLCIG